MRRDALRILFVCLGTVIWLATGPNRAGAG